jgi:hypothetical protein
MQRDDTTMGAQSRQGVGSSREPGPTKKKAYVPPVLVTWGTLRDMTQHAGQSGHMDGGKNKQQRKTH